ncbi:polysaccharide biosynthesis tyrosine autokinase [Pantoea sp. LS15]|uniref:polysaccharide biosynthesis tyrosine autokinase n=1 Tax=Enterobacterales TaxID=91347 RepID=UPI000E0E8F01|nr:MULTISPECIES: polysaccharide biosynthesis tyrosine autokinase [Enterobacterales]NJQ21825.1 polysaccharide biosynthesis tyrosine autokinase [Pantoea sp. LS15]NKF48421.1 polysaccharide biosynthesis tyrosine autokinase [Pantoea sp. LS15]RDK12978.1 protein-tyrosine kinase [Enterobacter sp. 9-2]
MSTHELPASSPRSEGEIDLFRLLGIVLERWKLIAGMTVIFSLLALVWTLMTTPVYRADTLIQVEKKQGNMLSGTLSSFMPELNTSTAPEIELLQSRMLLGETVRDLKLNIVSEPRLLPIVGKAWARLSDAAPSTLVVDRLHIPDGKPITLTVEDKSHYRLMHEGTLLEGEVGQPLEKAGFTLLISAIDAKPGTRFTVTQLSEQDAVRALQKRIVVSEKGKDSGMLSVSITGSDPAQLITILDRLAENYKRQNVARQTEQEARSLSFLQQLLTEVRSRLNDAEEKMNAYRQQSDSVDLNLEAKAVLEQIVNVDSQLNALTFQEAEISQLYKKGHPSYRALEDKRRTLEKEKTRLGQRISDMPSVQQEVLRLSREVESGQAVYLQLLSRQQELSISRSGITGNVRIIDTANIHPDPIKPKKVLIIFLGSLSGLLLSAGGVLVLNTLRQRVETPEQLEAAQLHVCATVPHSAWLLKVTRHTQGQTAGVTPLLAQENPNDLTVEAIRSLRTSLHFDMLEQEQNVLVVTGTTPDCGKTFVSSTLATVMAQSGQRVLFIDADMRRGDAHRVFGLEQREGLSSFLSGEKTIPCVLRTFDKTELDVITCGAYLQDPTTLLMGARFKTLLEWARQKYDVVIVDTPPALAVIDAAIIGRMTPLTLVVTRAGLNSVKETTLCVNKLEQEGISVKGVVLNGVVPGALSYFRDGYRCEGYRYTSPAN